MGFLSLMQREKDIKELNRIVNLYELTPTWQLYFLKQNEDYIGAIGVVIQQDYFIVQHIAVLPSYKGEGIEHLMLEKTQELLQPWEMQSTEETKALIDDWKEYSSIKNCIFHQ